MISTKVKGGFVAFFGAGALVAAAALATSGPAAAHHSFAMYDNDHQLKITGTVSDFQWTNPHVYIEVETDSGSAVKHYTIEGASPGILTRVGWKFNMIKKGDKLTMVIAPLKSGDAGALLKAVKLSDGRVFNNGAPAGKASIEL